MLDKPDARALLEAVGSFLTEEIAPVVDARVRFRALVAANVVRIALRELELGPRLLEQECARLRELLGEPTPAQSPATESLARELNAKLCARIESGQADGGEFRARVLDYLRVAVGAKLAIDNPKVGGRRD